MRPAVIDPSPAFAAPTPAAETKPVEAGPTAKTRYLEVSLVSERSAIAPGQTFMVAFVQRIQPGWHTYWRNPGDSGGPTTLNWTLPFGVQAGGIVWPLPERQRLADLMNYGYSGEVWLPVPVEMQGRDIFTVA